MIQNWNGTNVAFESGTKEYSKKLDKYLKYLDRTKKDMSVVVNMSHSGDDKADYENLVMRAKEKKDQLKELLFLLSKVKKLK